jgi:hypothetical protein
LNAYIQETRSVVSWRPVEATVQDNPILDLYTHRRKAKNKTLAQNKRWCLALFVLFLILFAVPVPLTQSLFLSLKRVQQEEITAARQMPEMQQLLNRQNEATARSQLRNRYTESQERRLGALACWKYIQAAVPGEVYVEQITLDMSTKPEKLIIRGGAESVLAMDRFYQQLLKCPQLDKVQLTESSQAPEIGKTGILFELDCTGRGSLTMPTE